MIRLIIPFLFLFFSLQLRGQDTIKKIKILPVPAIGYSPETKTYIGAVSLFTLHLYKDSVTRISNAKLELNYTWNKQLIWDSEWNYFFKEEKWFTKGKINYSDYPDYYYGIGSNTSNEQKLLFNSKRIIVEANLLKKIGPKLFFGPYFRYRNYFDLSTGEQSPYNELIKSLTTGAGLTLLSDTRNNILTPAKGLYLNLSGGWNFSTTDYWKISLDSRVYRTWKDKITLANRFFGEFNSGTPPFFDYSFLGGDQFVRGYTFGRYRDKNLVTWQSELRFPVIGRLGFAALGGLSNLYHSEFLISNLKYNYGMGLRFMVDKHDRTNLRLDYAIGESGNTGFYIAFGESF